VCPSTETSFRCPQIVVGASWGSMWGILVQRWMPLHWNVQPGLYAMLAATGVLGGVFRCVLACCEDARS